VSIGRLSDVKTFSAAALVLHIRVVEFEPFVQPFTREVELESVEIRETLRVDHNGHAVTFEAQVLGTDIVGVLELVGEAGAARRAYAETQPEALAPAGKMVRDMLRRVFGQSNRHCASCVLACCVSLQT